MDQNKRWLRKKSLRGRSASQALKAVFAAPKRSERFDFGVFICHGLFFGSMYAVLIFVVFLSINDGREASNIISRSLMSGVGLGLLMAAIGEIWKIGIVVEHVLTVVLGCILIFLIY